MKSYCGMSSRKLSEGFCCTLANVAGASTSQNATLIFAERQRRTSASNNSSSAPTPLCLIIRSASHASPSTRSRSRGARLSRARCWLTAAWLNRLEGDFEFPLPWRGHRQRKHNLHPHGRALLCRSRESTPAECRTPEIRTPEWLAHHLNHCCNIYVEH